jgi:hypothetical protein
MILKDTIYRIAHWETWDWRIKYIPIVPAWMWHCIRSGSLWFFTPSNPTLIFGGFEGETKQAIYKHLPPACYPKSMYIRPDLSYQKLEALVNHNFHYPFAVKPDIGRMGFMFRIINNLGELKLYHSKMPVDYIVQDLVKYPVEVSVFYYRFPNEQKGIITGFVRKEFLEVTGDGQSTLLQLMTNYPRIRFRLEEMKSKHKDKLDLILPEGQPFYLSYALNLSRGGKLVNLEHEKDDRLLKIFDSLSAHAKTLYYGRYDIKCSSIEDLKKGVNFSILEFNGSGAEPHHVYGNGYTLVEACKILAEHWNVLYKISKLNHTQGHPYYNFAQGWKLMRECRRHFAMLKKIDSEFPVS